MVKLNRDKIKRVIASVDWGFTNPGVILVWGIDGDDRMYLVHEVYKTQKLIDWWVERAKEINEFYHPDQFACDPSEPAYIMQFMNAGLNAQPADNRVKYGIQLVQKRLQIVRDGKPRIYFLDGCQYVVDEDLKARYKPVKTVDEFATYVWESSQNGKAEKEYPIKVDDHGLDAVRYAVAAVDFGRPKAGANPFY